MDTLPLDEPLAQQVLQYLQVDAAPPSLDALDELVAAYVRRVPWESASRIVRRAEYPTEAECARFPEIFWNDAMTLHTGGTCFESNYAFFGLLRHLGYEGYLTINNMRESIGCHTAIVINLDGQRYLVDAGLPLHVPIPLDEHQRTQRESEFHLYSATPQGDGQYLIERDKHPRPDCFTLIDTPVNDADYRAALMNDYGEDGLFLDRVIVVRVVDEHISRFSGDVIPYHLETFYLDEDAGEYMKVYKLLGDQPEKAAEKLSKHFGLDVKVLQQAFTVCPGIEGD